jgi:hypothetical protein
MCLLVVSLIVKTTYIYMLKIAYQGVKNINKNCKISVKTL